MCIGSLLLIFYIFLLSDHLCEKMARDLVYNSSFFIAVFLLSVRAYAASDMRELTENIGIYEQNLLFQ